MFARNPDWTYAVAIDQLSDVAERTVDWPGLAAPVALFAGALLGARVSGRFELRRPAPGPALRVPGGWRLDGTVRERFPAVTTPAALVDSGITVYGIVAYAVTTGTIAATIWGMRR